MLKSEVSKPAALLINKVATSCNITWGGRSQVNLTARPLAQLTSSCYIHMPLSHGQVHIARGNTGLHDSGGSVLTFKTLNNYILTLF
jgi:hypothetical protein